MSKFSADHLPHVETYTHHTGRLFVVGDIHGYYDALMEKLSAIQFNFQTDVLIAVGDLVDRGPDSLKCLNLIDEPWFKSILGNHEEMCILSHVDPMMKNLHAQHGGEWFYALSFEQQKQIIQKLETLPVLLEVLHQNKKYGFVHADIDVNDWDVFKVSTRAKSRELALWGRGRIKNKRFMRYSTVQGVEQVFLGHTVVDFVTKKHNCYFLDTGACFGSELTVVEIDCHLPVEKQVYVLKS
ncbi:MAG: Serine/threonine-protein phosphatase 1 [Acinetobacter bereziniae]|uniref:Serine/threonine-protein phosphatase 1 n=1 Tax=Acinetobacter bereziniae TaxID=106648 RepID=A0A833PB73_ACIBZ|nr:MAG: Serine/threonine-protein phosphatase 1 [Acinetobacter bereziniae]